MSYATLQDLLGHLAESDLAALSDDGRAEDIDEAVAAHILSDAAATIDAHCGGRYQVPFGSPAPAMARILSLDIAVFMLYARRAATVELPEAVEIRYEAALGFLKQVQTGSASLGPDAPLLPAGSGGGQAGLAPGNERLFRREQTKWL